MITNYGDLQIDIDPFTGRAKVVRRDECKLAMPSTDQPRVIASASSPPHPAPGPRRDQDRPKYRSKLEGQYAGHLDALRHIGQIRDVRYEALTLKLAPRTTYTPDFLVELPDRTVVLHEVKGWMREDAWVKLKIAASLWPWFRWFLVTRNKGEWIIKRVPSA